MRAYHDLQICYFNFFLRQKDKIAQPQAHPELIVSTLESKIFSLFFDVGRLFVCKNKTNE